MAATGRAPTWGSCAAEPTVQAVLARNHRLRRVLPVGDVGSTQDVAAAAATDPSTSGTVVIADRQLAGRGRSGRPWDDDRDGGSLALTLILDPPVTAALVPHALGLAVVGACAGLLEGAVTPRLKWPNDVVVRADGDGPLRKLAGILVERDRIGDRDVLLCGIGLNVDLRHAERPVDRTCLAALSGTTPSRPALLAALLTALDGAIDELHRAAGAVLERYRDACDTIGRAVAVELPGGHWIVGQAVGIDDDGHLLVDVDGRIETIVAGTVRDHAGDEPGVGARSGPGRPGPGPAPAPVPVLDPSSEEQR